jgi:tRNA-splicing ligase RtcB
MFGAKEIHSRIPTYSVQWLKGKCQQIGMNYEYMLQGLGSLGGGNHYIEVNKGANEQLYITIHTGSRNFGGKICKFHQEKINETKFFDYETLHDKMKRARRKVKDSKKLKEIQDDLCLELNAKRHPDYLEKIEAYDYYFDMIFAQKYAKLNRKMILELILEQIYLAFKPENLIESIHNYIDFNDLILRKGAISAHKDKLCIVSLNMRDGILLCKGKGNEDWNYSSAHGAGRILNRSQALSKISLKMFKESMKDVYSTTVQDETIDESPFAYKDSELIKKSLTNSVEIIEQLKPILNVKATT